jgi:diacylglycerol kinase family enzyme
LRVETQPAMALYADGEYVCETPVEVRVVPQALTVIV